jgi:hypothetical protein
MSMSLFNTQWGGEGGQNFWQNSSSDLQKSQELVMKR